MAKVDFITNILSGTQRNMNLNTPPSETQHWLVGLNYRAVTCIRGLQHGETVCNTSEPNFYARESGENLIQPHTQKSEM